MSEVMSKKNTDLEEKLKAHMMCMCFLAMPE
jgi:hypothetical protein